jgi:hypothetical protein
MGTTLAQNPATVYAAKEGRKFAADTTLVVVECPTCGVTYAIPERFQRSAQRYHGDSANGWKICCPFGHTWWYVGETELALTKRLLESERDRRASLKARLDQTEASLRGTKAAGTRARNELRRTKERVKNGVCPCCNRTFVRLGQHMAKQHPDYRAA